MRLLHEHGRSFADQCVIAVVCLDNCYVSEALCPRARRELNSTLGSFRDNRTSWLPSISRHENFRIMYRVRNITKILQVIFHITS